MKMNIHKIITDEKDNIDDPNNKVINKKYKLIDNIIKSSIICFIKQNDNIYKHYNFTYNNQRHKLDVIIPEIITFFRYAKTYRSSDKIPKSTLYDHIYKLTSLGVFKNTYSSLLDQYLIKTPSKKLKSRYTDTTFVVNKYGTEKIGYSGKHKRTGTKVSLDTDLNGVVLRDYISAGNVYDSKLYVEQYNNDYYSDKVKKYNKKLIADSGYDSSIIKNKCKEDNIKCLIKYNKRKCKNEEIINQNKMSEKDFELYKTRFSIENTNGLLKSIHRVQTRYDRKIKNFHSSLHFSYIDRIIKIIIKGI